VWALRQQQFDKIFDRRKAKLFKLFSWHYRPETEPKSRNGSTGSGTMSAKDGRVSPQQSQSAGPRVELSAQTL
jgi:hypothetical protein